MPLPFFKKKKEEGKEPRGEKPEPGTAPEPQKAKERQSLLASNVLLKEFLSEKASMMREQNQYVFGVSPKASKTDVKRAVEELYGVEVEHTTVAHVPAKTRRRGRFVGERPGYKKAIVTLKKGQTIEALGV